MILPFKEQFVEPIMSGRKIHTIREDRKNRWIRGKTIHFATGVRTKNQNTFYSNLCRGTQEIKIYWRGNTVYPVAIFIDKKVLTLDETERLAINDGFKTVDEFYKWFDSDFKGKIIHWTELRY